MLKAYFWYFLIKFCISLSNNSVHLICVLCVQLKTEYAEGRIDARTRVWAPGLDGWKPLTQVAQTKWHLCPSSGSGSSGASVPVGASTGTSGTPGTSGGSGSSGTSGSSAVPLVTGAPLVNESQLAHMVLANLLRMCSYYPSRDTDGAIVRPLPRAKRLISEPQSLSQIVQVRLPIQT